MIISKLNIFNIQLSKTDYPGLLDSISESLKKGTQTTITGANVNTINLAIKDQDFFNVISKINIIHPDGMGIFLTSRFLYGNNGFPSRITGSDFYVELIKHSIKNNWSFFFLGDKETTLNKISLASPGIIIKGLYNGYNLNNEELVDNINITKPDILIVGMGSPKQEEWIIKNKDQIITKVIIAVGDGIKIFAGIKRRGPKIIQLAGLEWFVRLIFEPKRLWKRYLIGIPLFIYRLFKYKFTSQQINN